MKAIDAVANLRALADLLEKHGDANIRMSSATIWFDGKESFLAVAKHFPRPFEKKYDSRDSGELTLEFGTLDKTGKIALKIPRSTVCTMIEPAKPAVYECDPLLSPEEELAL